MRKKTMTTKNNNKKNKLPPPILVKTWVNMMRSSEDNIARERAKDMLLGAFEDMQSVAAYMKKHGIS